MLTRLMGIGALAACALSGCVANAPSRYPDGDPDLFREEVQPVLQRSCAFEGCHGHEGMPLTLYAVDFLRLVDPEGDVDTGRTALDERALSETELDHNRRSIAGRVSAADPEGVALIDRLLPPEAGGIPHAGFVAYENPEHPDVETLRAFLRTVDVE